MQQNSQLLKSGRRFWGSADLTRKTVQVETCTKFGPYLNLGFLLCFVVCPTVSPATHLHTSGSKLELGAEVLTRSSDNLLLSCLCWAAFLYRRCLNRWNSSSALSLTRCVSQLRARHRGEARRRGQMFFSFTSWSVTLDFANVFITINFKKHFPACSWRRVRTSCFFFCGWSCAGHHTNALAVC